jgi:hypothetical protein
MRKSDYFERPTMLRFQNADESLCGKLGGIGLNVIDSRNTWTI